MQISGFNQSPFEYPVYFNNPAADFVVPEEKADDFDDRKKGNVAATEKSDFDGNPYYEDPKHSTAAMPILGCRRDDLLETGVGSEGARGIAGFGESLNELNEGALDDVSGVADAAG